MTNEPSLFDSSPTSHSEAARSPGAAAAPSPSAQPSVQQSGSAGDAAATASHVEELARASLESGCNRREQKHALIEEMTEKALTELGEALAAGKSEHLTRYLTAMAKFHDYSVGNLMLIAWQRPDATHVAGFHTWKKLGRSVRKGEHGIMILAPVLRHVADAVEREDDGTEKVRPVRQIVNTRPVHVFDVSQTEGKELPRFAKTRGEPAVHALRLKAFIASKNIRLEYASNLGGALGLSEGGRICCLDSLTPADEFHTLVHEVGHELLHRGERRKETSRRTRELEAEAVAFVVCTAVGLDAKAASTDYIHLYRGDKERLAESLQFIRSVANQIIDALISNPAREPNVGTVV